jgi:dihydrofolate reductase
MMISMIVAVAENGVIGKNNDLPWHLPDDLKFFKNTTKGHVILMGRKCFESFGKPLPHRTNVIITRNTEYKQEGAKVVHSLEDALSVAKEKQETEVFVCGGEEIYRQSMDKADKLYLTRIHAKVEGDVHFPDFDEDQWELISEEYHSTDEKHVYDFTFRTYIKKR